jgi:hypothetical protein
MSDMPSDAADGVKANGSWGLIDKIAGPLAPLLPTVIAPAAAAAQETGVLGCTAALLLG